MNEHLLNYEADKRTARKKKFKRIWGIGLTGLLIVFLCMVVYFDFIKKSNYHHHIDTIIVETKAGAFKGYKETFNGKTSYKFKGIPYAEPPVGSLRWKAPLAKPPLSGVYDANRSHILCMQFGFEPPPELESSEDCLYLHIHTPSLDTNADLPVFVWLHGGFLMFLYSDKTGYYPDGEFATSMNIVSVSIGYRLNAFGYLTLEELWEKNESYGNYGLFDQIMALQWIKDNIKNFGGNPDLVTLSGQSSGGTSIYALLASPLADGLFKRAIPMSGSPYFPRNYTVAASDNRIFVNRSSCSHQISIQLKECLYNLSPKEVVKMIPGSVYPNWLMKDLNDFPEYKHFDGSVLVVDPISLPVVPKDAYILSKLKSKVDLLIGTTAQEVGFNPVRTFKSDTELTKFLEERLLPFKSITAEDVHKTYENMSTYVKTNITTQFLFETLTSDVRVTCPNTQLMKEFRRSRLLENTYRYVSAWKPEKEIKIDMVLDNAAHMTDAIALFGFKMWEKRPLTLSEKTFMATIRKVFGKFIREGVVDFSKPGETLVFNGEGKVDHIQGDYHQEQCKIWDDPSNGFLPYAWIN